MEKKSALGRGLGALIDIQPTVQTSGSSLIDEVELSKIEANPDQPRTNFNEEALSELAASIAELGVVQPITIREIEPDKYMIIAGERRYRASKLAGLTKIPAYIKRVSDETMMEMALVENIQREDLNAIEIALTYQRLLDEYKFTQEKLSERVGKKRATVANYLRLLKLLALLGAQSLDNHHLYRILLGPCICIQFFWYQNISLIFAYNQNQHGHKLK